MPRLSSAAPLELYLLWAATPAALGGVMWEQGMSAGASAPADRRRRPTHTPSARTFPLDATQQKKSPSSSEPAESHRQGGSTPWPTRRPPNAPTHSFTCKTIAWAVRRRAPHHARVVGNDPAECETTPATMRPRSAGVPGVVATSARGRTRFARHPAGRVRSCRGI